MCFVFLQRARLLGRLRPVCLCNTLLQYSGKELAIQADLQSSGKQLMVIVIINK